MSKKFKSQASSARAASALTGGFGSGSSFQTSSSPLSYVTESPDLSLISSPNVVVAFKNLGKKDSTTKAKALEELQEYCSGDVDQGVLQAWADIYPRTSIDNSRRVRQLAHGFQGALTVTAGKRIAPVLSKVIGSWLAGTFDNDKSVSRSAQDALERSFTTPEKRQALWSVYKDALFTYIEDAITVQTTATLSDERMTSSDDAQAKYVRVVGTAMNMLAELLRGGAKNDLISTLLGGKKLWEFVYHDDAYLRRGACDLVTIACENYAEQLDWLTLATCFLSKGLHSSQAGSSRQYTSSLLVLTQQRPELWTTDYTAKTDISRRLTQFLKKGSQSGPEDVWSNITQLIRLIPEQVWRSENQLASATAMAEALRTGVTQSTERPNAVAAWATYVQTCLWLSERLDEKVEFLNQQLVPIVKQYIMRREEQQWTITARVVQICRGIIVGMIKQGAVGVLESTWSDLVSSTINEMKLSQPETSKDFTSSQDAVTDQAKRLFNIKTEVLKAAEPSQIDSMFQLGDDHMLDAAFQLLRARNGKPYGAAGVVEIIANQPGFDMSSSKIKTFLEEDLRSLLDSPSSQRLTSIALKCGQTSIIDSLLAQHSNNADKALCHALTLIKAEDLSQQSQEKILDYNLNDMTESRRTIAVMQNPSLHELHFAICKQIQQSTANTSLESQRAALTLLDELLKQPTSANVVASDEYRPLLLSNLLVIADSRSDLSEKANTIITKLNGKSRSSTGSTSIIQQQLNGEGTPLSIFTLIDLASDLAQDDVADLDVIVPTKGMWEKALLPHTLSPRPYSLSITSPLQGLLFTLDTATTYNGYGDIKDQDDFSLAFRLFLYITKLLTSNVASRFHVDTLQALYPFYPLALQLVNEKLTAESANEIWTHTTPEVLQEAADVLSEGNKLVQSWLSNKEFFSCWMKVPHGFEGSDLAMYTKALAWTSIAAQHIDQHGPSQLLQEYENELIAVHKSDDVVRSAVLLAVLREYLVSASYGKKVLNELVADVTELKRGKIKPLVLLNILLQGGVDMLETIPTQRVVFLLKNLVRLLDDRETTGLQSEVMKLLVAIIPQTLDIYGEHWEQILGAVIRLWSSDVDLSAMNASVRLYARLKALLKAEDANEDFQDAWKSANAELDTGLLECLQQLGRTSTNETDQPRNITAELIRRQLRDVDLKNDEDLFTLLSSSVEAVQTAAFEVLHRTIPQRQEQLSVELVLEKRAVHLPQELMTLLADEQSDPRRYLLAWNLAFDHFSNASYKLQEAYTAQMKDSGHIDGLLNHICQVLRIVSGRPIDASKFDASSFNLDEADSFEKEMQWLSIHNYYSALLCVPSLAKEWFIAQKNRVKSPLEAWTQRYISPLIVTASLSTVTNWASAQSQDGDERSLIIKSSPRGSELIASIAVDPESPPISLAISLPGSYPLESPIVTSRTRVGVSEKNWQSWLRTITIIIFSTGSIIEGLIAFRRNIQGALKGQSECAICYSIIGTDMQTPNKKCGTCKNMFHGTCLFRWFKSSNSSSCPLCRNNFNYA